MENGAIIGNLRPQAFHDPRTEMLKHLLWCLLSAGILIGIFIQMNLTEIIQKTDITKMNSFRISILCFSVVLVISIYLFMVTTRGPDRHFQMQARHPIAAYTMTAFAVILLISTLILTLDLLKFIGIVFYFSFWIFFFNLLFLLKF